MSPEEVLGIRNDRRSDLYCLGLTYLHLRTSRPFPRHRDQPIPEPNEYGKTTGITADCIATLMRLLEKDPAHRFQTAQDTLASLQRIQFLPAK
jgi:serine/threonine protein kinase